MVTWLLNALILMLCAAILPGVEVSGYVAALLAVALISLVNALVGPIVTLLTLPLTFVTLGLFLFVVNGFLFYLAGSVFAGFQVNGGWNAILAALVYSLATSAVKTLRSAAKS